MTKYHDPKQGKTVEASNRAEAKKLLEIKTEAKTTKPTVTKPTPKVTAKKDS